MTLRLTDRQKYFLWTLLEEPSAWSGCDPCEGRTADGLAHRSIVELDGRKPGRHFEARVRPDMIEAVSKALANYIPPTHEAIYARGWRG